MKLRTIPVAPRPVEFLPRLLFSPRKPTHYASVAIALSLAGALLLSLVARALFPALEGPEFPFSGWTFLFAVVVLAPILETAILAVVLEILRRLVSPWSAVLVCAGGWGLAHSSAAPAWGLVIWWPFVVFSVTYLTWRQRSLVAAFAMAFVVHAAQNAVAAIPNAFA